MMIFLFLILGLVVGSFLNVVIVRLRDAETLLGRSFCRHCKHQIAWYDNVPLLSFALLRGECRACQTRISWQYPAVEAFTGIAFAVTGALFFDPVMTRSWIETVWLLVLFSGFIVIAAYDLKYMEIPLSVLIFSILWSVVMLFFLGSGGAGTPFFLTPIGSGLIGGGVIALLFFLLVFLSKETWMGWGDVWLGLAAGLAVGFPWGLILLTLSFGLGSVIGIALMLSRKKSLKSQVPFAPFLVSGTMLTIILPKLFPALERLSLLPFFW